MTSVTSSTSTITSPYATVKEQIRPGRFESNEKEYGTVGAAVLGVGDAISEGASATVSLSEKALNAVEEGASYIGNAVQTAHFLRSAFGMTLVGYTGPETGNHDHHGYVLTSGAARFVVLGAYDPASSLADHHRRHGDGIVDIALGVPDVDRCIAHARAEGARKSIGAARGQITSNWVLPDEESGPAASSLLGLNR